MWAEKELYEGDDVVDLETKNLNPKWWDVDERDQPGYKKGEDSMNDIGKVS